MEWVDLRAEPMSKALDYFNRGRTGTGHLRSITREARAWCWYYFGGADGYGTKRAYLLLRAHPDLFNFSTEPHRQLRRASLITYRHATHDGDDDTTEPFPEWTEPIMATDEELEEIVDLRLQRKPEMRVNANDLRGSAVLSHLPEFMAQLARANRELETRVALTKQLGVPMAEFAVDEDADDEDDDNDDDDEAGDDDNEQPHVEMDIYAGVLEEQPQEQGFDLRIPASGTMPSASSARRHRSDDEGETSTSPSSSESSSSSSSSSSSRTKIRLVGKHSRDLHTSPSGPSAPATRADESANKTSSSAAMTSSSSSSSSGGEETNLSLKRRSRPAQADNDAEEERSSKLPRRPLIEEVDE